MDTANAIPTCDGFSPPELDFPPPDDDERPLFIEDVPDPTVNFGGGGGREGGGEEGEGGGPFFGNLPHVVIDKVFDKLPIGVKLRTMSVCKAWNYFAVASLRRETEFSRRNFSSDQDVTIRIDSSNMEKLFDKFGQIPTGATKIRRFDSTGFFDVGPQFEAITGDFVTGRCPNLEVFEGKLPLANIHHFAENCKGLYDCTTTSGESALSESCIRVLVNKCKQLKHLGLQYGARVSDDGDESPFEDARCSLETLDVPLLNRDIPVIVRKFSNLKWLKGRVRAEMDFTALKRLRLKTLVLWCYDNLNSDSQIKLFCSPTIGSPLFQSLVHLCLVGSWNLRHDDIGSTKMTEATNALLQIGKFCPKLQKLDLSRAGFLPFLFDPPNTDGLFLELRDLNLFRCYWPSGFSFTLPNLTDLYLSHYQPRLDEGLSCDLSSFLPGCPKIQGARPR